jgi:glycosyltransferase involved in cell wall biosynthesis
MPHLIEHNVNLQTRIFEIVEAFFALNQSAADVWLANGAPRSKVRVNRLGVSGRTVPVKRSPQLAPTTPPVKVGYLGRITALKGVGELAHAFASLPRDVPLQLEFRGTSSGESDQLLLAQLKRVVGDDRRVSFKEACTPDEAASIIMGYDVLCVPSKWFENGPTVMLEAHAVGTPVIGTTIGAMPEVITHGINGWLVEPGDIQSLADALHMIALDSANTVDLWRRNLPPPRTMHEIAADYLTLYES